MNICETTQCTLQDWLSATSGWAGLVVAIVAAYYVYHQLEEQRKQTAFIIGDGIPTLEMYLAAMSGARAVFRIVNWNRRLFSIRRIKIEASHITPPTPVSLLFHEPDSDNVISLLPARVRPNGYFVEVHAANGWINRQGPPHVLDFEVHFDAREDYTEVLKHATNDDKARIIVTCRFEDGQEKDLQLAVKIELRDLLPNNIKRSDYDMAP
ncbi:hypothetical protein [Agrobacterium vitis]|uniref:Uncharacterized protein n=1 Tax=Agrobacterium vitis TaxID=373 RepID=A0AAE2RD85_AGRVI|nr:hypothetical protein [Agrobacterium vitis]MBF2714337.1 hypothetical protein [Agrobacterium vitis]MVA21999.1 hypothetical protein [Agrobacterium vitis]